MRMSVETTVLKGNRATTRAEYNLYRDTAREMGFQSMATAAAIGFELCPRVWDVFGFKDPDGDKRRGITWTDYAPGKTVTIRQSKKGGKAVVIPLSEIIDGQKSLFYPDLEAELLRTTRSAVLIVVEERNGLPYSERRMSTVHRAICEKAGLPKEMTFTGFRHGGITELGDAGAEDVRSITGHTEAKTTEIYNKANERKARIIAAKRREHIAMIDALDKASA